MSQALALIIEDDPQLSDIFALALSGQFQTEVIQDGQLGLQRLDEITPDVVVLDLHLPGVSGEKILHHLRNEARLAAVRVILATADARQAEILESQADIVLLKPINPMQLNQLAVRLYEGGKRA